MMRVWGVWLIFVGVIWLVIAFNMDTSVVSYRGMYGADRVENIGLIARRQNHLMVASLITLIGTLMTIFGSGRTGERASSTEVPNFQVANTPPCERDLSLDAYRLWLAAKYDIKKNEVFDSFIYDDQIFKSLDDALKHAHAQEEALLAEIEEKLIAKKEEEIRRSAALNIELERQAVNGRKFAIILVIIPIILSAGFMYRGYKKTKNDISSKEEKVFAYNEISKNWQFNKPEDWEILSVINVKDSYNENSKWCKYKAGALVKFKSPISLDSGKENFKILDNILPNSKNPYGNHSGEYEYKAREYELRDGTSLIAHSTKEGDIYVCEIAFQNKNK